MAVLGVVAAVIAALLTAVLFVLVNCLPGDNAQSLACGLYSAHTCMYFDIHNAWVPVCSTLCILYLDHKLDSVSLLLTTYLLSTVMG